MDAVSSSENSSRSSRWYSVPLLLSKRGVRLIGTTDQAPMTSSRIATLADEEASVAAGFGVAAGFFFSSFFGHASCLCPFSPQLQQTPIGRFGPFDLFPPVLDPGFSLVWAAAATPGLVSFFLVGLWRSYSSRMRAIMSSGSRAKDIVGAGIPACLAAVRADMAEA